MNDKMQINGKLSQKNSIEYYQRIESFVIIYR